MDISNNNVRNFVTIMHELEQKKMEEKYQQL